MQARRWIAVGLALLATSAGCIGLADPLTDDEHTETLQRRAAPSPAQARLAVEVVDPALNPLGDANVTVETSQGARTASTDPAGLARFAELAAGRAIVAVEAPRHHGRELSVDLDAGETVERTVVLQPLPGDRTVVQRFRFQGFFECSATYLIIAGDCLAPVHAIAEEAGVDPEADATNERHVFRFPVGAGWSTVHVTQTWEDPVAAVGSSMRVNLEPVDPNNTDGHSPQFAEVQGASPIELTVEAGQVHATADPDDLAVPEEGGWLRTRTFHTGVEDTDEPAGTSFLGVGAAVQQSFTVTVEVRYG